jgi:hypothetical protein
MGLTPYRVIATQTSLGELAKHRLDGATGMSIYIYGGVEVMCYVSRGVACRLTPHSVRGVAIWVTCSSELVRTLLAYGTSPAAIAVITEW